MSLHYGEHLGRLWLDEKGDDMMMGWIWICSER
jgi:hypothetical protein